MAKFGTIALKINASGKTQFFQKRKREKRVRHWFFFNPVLPICKHVTILYNPCCSHPFPQTVNYKPQNSCGRNFSTSPVISGFLQFPADGHRLSVESLIGAVDVVPTVACHSWPVSQSRQGWLSTPFAYLLNILSSN